MTKSILEWWNRINQNLKKGVLWKVFYQNIIRINHRRFEQKVDGPYIQGKTKPGNQDRNNRWLHASLKSQEGSQAIVSNLSLINAMGQNPWIGGKNRQLSWSVKFGQNLPEHALVSRGKDRLHT